MYSRIFALPLLAVSLAAQTAPPVKTVTLRSSLVEQLRTTHNRQEWFVPANAAVEGLTPKQASWTDGSGNHSVGQLANHLIFWNRQQLARMRGEPTARPGNNDETFNAFDAAKWSATVRELDEVLSALEKEVEGMSMRSCSSSPPPSDTLPPTTPITWGRCCSCANCRAVGTRRAASSSASGL